MRILVPFDATAPKSRLSSLLTDAERREFADAMCHDVVAAIRSAGHDPTLLATDNVDGETPVLVDDRPLTTAVNDALADASLPVGIVMADLPLVRSGAIHRLVGREDDVVIAPGLGGGTNALVIRHPDFRVDYHGGSYRKHRSIATEADASVGTVDSFRLALDVDEPADLGEVLLHSEGEAADWLRDAGFSLDETGDRAAVTRETGDR
jgi:2-phospho-L-lactate guanylyltransferase